jgi:hypothetical protein
MTLYTERKTGSPLQREYRYPALWMVETKVKESRRKRTLQIIIETKEKASCRKGTPKLSNIGESKSSENDPQIIIETKTNASRRKRKPK